jgi:hypothetical protein
MADNIQLYGVSMLQAMGGGDLEEMKRLKEAAERHVKENGDVASLLQHLKVEIAKAEGKKG